MAIVHDMGRNRTRKKLEYFGYQARCFASTILYFAGLLYSGSLLFVVGWFIPRLLNRLFFDFAFIEQVYQFLNRVLSPVVDRIIEGCDAIAAYGEILAARISSKILQAVVELAFLTLPVLLLIGLVPSFGKLLRSLSKVISNDPGGKFAGIYGEKRALKLLSRLPNDYHIFVNLEFEMRGHHETDLILAGPGGVCVCEVKYWSGEIYYPEDDFRYVYRKSKNGKYYSAVHSPMHQVLAHYETLRDALRAKGVNVRTSGVVLMMHPKVKLVNFGQSWIPALTPPFETLILQYMGSDAINIEKTVAALQEIAL